jgi:hypothetical protein
VRAEDQFHVGIVVDDLQSALAELSAVFGYEWCDDVNVPTLVTLSTGEQVVDMRFAYSKTTPRLEVIQSTRGALWEPTTGSVIHHLGYWSDDVAADSDKLTQRGFAIEAVGRRPDGAMNFAFHSSVAGARIELVSRTVQPAFEHYWATGKMPA